MAVAIPKRCAQCFIKKPSSCYGLRKKQRNSVCWSCVDAKIAEQRKKSVQQLLAEEDYYRNIQSLEKIATEKIAAEVAEEKIAAAEEKIAAAEVAEEEIKKIAKEKIINFIYNFKIELQQHENTTLYSLAKLLGITSTNIKVAFWNLIEFELQRAENIIIKNSLETVEFGVEVLTMLDQRLCEIRYSLTMPMTEKNSRAVSEGRQDVMKRRRLRDTQKAIISNKSRRKSDIVFRLKCNLRGRISNAMNHYIKKGKTRIKAGSTVKDLGCGMLELKTHLENQFETGMSWNNYGNKAGQWSIDHIFPISKADLTDRKEFLKVAHYTNLRPMWHVDNVKKGNKLLI